MSELRDRVIQAIANARSLENCFRTATGEVDLMEMSTQLPERVFREYIAIAQALRAGKHVQPS